jgi:hypothetical protein
MQIQRLGEFYKADLCGPEDLPTEYTHINLLLNNWEWSESSAVPRDLEDLLSFLLVNGLVSTFPNLTTLLRIGLTIPISSSHAERSFSYLRKLKDYCRTRMGEERVSNLACLAMNRDIAHKIDSSKYIDAFAAMKTRLLNL